MNIGTATLKTLGKDGTFLTIPVDNPALGYEDFVSVIKNTFQSPAHIAGIGAELEAEPANMAHQLEIEAETNALFIDFEDAGNAKEAYEVKIYLIADLEA